MLTSVGVQQSAVPKCYQASTSASSRFLEVSQVVGLLSSELWLDAIAGRFLQAECYKVLAEYSTAAMPHHLESGQANLQLPSDENSIAGAKLVVVTFARGREFLVQGL